MTVSVVSPTLDQVAEEVAILKSVPQENVWDVEEKRSFEEEAVSQFGTLISL